MQWAALGILHKLFCMPLYKSNLQRYWIITKGVHDCLHRRFIGGGQGTHCAPPPGKKKPTMYLIRANFARYSCKIRLTSGKTRVEFRRDLPLSEIFRAGGESGKTGNNVCAPHPPPPPKKKEKKEKKEHRFQIPLLLSFHLHNGYNVNLATDNFDKFVFHHYYIDIILKK